MRDESGRTAREREKIGVVEFLGAYLRCRFTQLKNASKCSFSLTILPLLYAKRQRFQRQMFSEVTLHSISLFFLIFLSPPFFIFVGLIMLIETDSAMWTLGLTPCIYLPRRQIGG